MTNEREPLWTNQRIRDRYHALVPCEANMGEMEYWNVLRDVGERVSYELRDEYESTIDTLISDNNRIFDRAATRLAEIYELRARIAELEQELAQTWLPVWGIEINGIEVDAGGNSIGMTAIDAHGCKWYAESDLPANIRLCRRQEADDAA